MVTNPNTPPVANPDTVTTAFNTSIPIDVLANDRDADGDTLSISSFTQGAHGTVTKVDKQLVYTPNPGFNGTDTFTYYI